MKPLVIALLMGAAAANAGGQPIYRCGTNYSSSPCPQGKLLDSADPRTAAERAAAKTVAASERKQAEAMERDRRAREATIKPAAATGLSAAPVAKPAASAPKKSSKKKTKKPQVDQTQDFVATVPVAKKKPANSATPH